MNSNWETLLEKQIQRDVIESTIEISAEELFANGPTSENKSQSTVLSETSD